MGESLKPAMASKALCVFHETSVASVSCERCGDFICDECVQTLHTRQVCQSCYKNYGGTLLSDFLSSSLLFLSFFLALRGRKNCDPEAWPPVGGMKEAQNALILSTLGFFLWIAILIFGAMP